jgi:hypothetical protein
VKKNLLTQRIKKGLCVFCGDKVVGIGNNPAPIVMHEDAVCCNFCNANIVIRGRLEAFYREEAEDNKEGEAV